MEYDFKNHCYIEYTKLSNGQTAMIVLDEYTRGYTHYYWVTFGIANKKKQLRNWFLEQDSSLDLQSTGRCGAEGLHWAYKKIKEFIEEHERWNDDTIFKHKIAVQGADKRRHNIYRHFLKRLGFKEENDPDWGWIITKSFEKS